MVLRFESGALGTFVVWDAAASARSWEQTAKENLSYPHYSLTLVYLESPVLSRPNALSDQQRLARR